jgi:hypothetical protein
MRKAAPSSAPLSAQTSARIFVLVFLMAVLPLANAGTCGASREVAAGTLVDHYLVDPVLKLSWAVVRDCHHPAGPAWLVPVASQPDGSALGSGTDSGNGRDEAEGSDHVDPARLLPSRQWVPAGSRVRLWETGRVRIQFSGIAVESAPVGAEVTVRTGDRGMLLRGIVRGADSVELVGSVKRWGEQ